MANKIVRDIFRRYAPALEPWQIRLAFGRIQAFKLPVDIWDDVMQDLVLIICTFEYDPEKAYAASEKTVLTRMMDNRIRMIIRSHARYQYMLQRLKAIMEMDTVEPMLPEEEASILELHEIINELTPIQQEVCQGLMYGDSLPTIAEETGRGWSTIQYHVQRITQVFKDRGLDQWFE